MNKQRSPFTPDCAVCFLKMVHMQRKIVIVLQVFWKFMCNYTILKNFVDKRNKLGLNFVI